MEKAFEKQTKTTEDQGKDKLILQSQLEAIKLKELEEIEDKSDDNEKNLKYNDVFNELSNE